MHRIKPSSLVAVLDDSSAMADCSPHTSSACSRPPVHVAAEFKARRIAAEEPMLAQLPDLAEIATALAGGAGMASCGAS